MNAANSDTAGSGSRRPVDLVLVLAADCSFSIDDSEFSLQTVALAAAINSPQVIAAIQKGRLGRIAVSIVQWAGFGEQAATVDWTIVSGKSDAAALAQTISQMKRRFQGNYSTGATDITSAVEYTMDHTLDSPFSSDRHVIDISGDGKNNVNLPPDHARDAAVRAGLVINGLVITNRVKGLANYYRRHVIGGHRAFVETAADFEDFRRAIQRKLVREIAPRYSS